MSVPDDAAVQQEKAEPVVGEVAESEADSFDPLAEQVDRLGGSVVDPAGGEVGQPLIFPGGDGAPEAVQLGDVGVRAGPV